MFGLIVQPGQMKKYRLPPAVLQKLQKRAADTHKKTVKAARRAREANGGQTQAEDAIAAQEQQAGSDIADQGEPRTAAVEGNAEPGEPTVASVESSGVAAATATADSGGDVRAGEGSDSTAQVPPSASADRRRSRSAPGFADVVLAAARAKKDKSHKSKRRNRNDASSPSDSSSPRSTTDMTALHKSSSKTMSRTVTSGAFMMNPANAQQRKLQIALGNIQTFKEEDVTDQLRKNIRDLVEQNDAQAKEIQRLQCVIRQMETVKERLVDASEQTQVEMADVELQAVELTADNECQTEEGEMYDVEARNQVITLQGEVRELYATQSELFKTIGEWTKKEKKWLAKEERWRRMLENTGLKVVHQRSLRARLRLLFLGAVIRLRSLKQFVAKLQLAFNELGGVAAKEFLQDAAEREERQAMKTGFATALSHVQLASDTTSQALIAAVEDIGDQAFDNPNWVEAVKGRAGYLNATLRAELLRYKVMHFHWFRSLKTDAPSSLELFFDGNFGHFAVARLREASHTSDSGKRGSTTFGRHRESSELRGSLSQARRPSIYTGGPRPPAEPRGSIVMRRPSGVYGLGAAPAATASARRPSLALARTLDPKRASLSAGAVWRGGQASAKTTFLATELLRLADTVSEVHIALHGLYRQKHIWKSVSSFMYQRAIALSEMGSKKDQTILSLVQENDALRETLRRAEQELKEANRLADRIRGPTVRFRHVHAAQKDDRSELKGIYAIATKQVDSELLGIDHVAATAATARPSTAGVRPTVHVSEEQQKCTLVACRPKSVAGVRRPHTPSVPLLWTEYSKMPELDPFALDGEADLQLVEEDMDAMRQKYGFSLSPRAARMLRPEMQQLVKRRAADGSTSPRSPYLEPP